MPTCALHRFHHPKPLSVEKHHVIPRAWQNLWTPGVPSAVLWAPETVILCATSHSNVHTHLVAMMRDFDMEDPDECLKAYPVRTNPEVRVAYLGMREFVKRGGTLSLLRSKKAYGYGITNLRIIA